MKESLRSRAATHYCSVAEDYDVRQAGEGDAEEKAALRIVAAQNYFYSAINIIEAFLARRGIHSFNHENRARNVLENKELFEEGLVELFDLVDRDQRNKVTYRGEDGQKYLNIKRLAELLRESYGKQV